MEFKELFSLDKRDYKPDAKVNTRSSARGIIFQDGKVLLMHSLKYDYYKFPGGGVEKGETIEDALIREVKEESGYEVIRESIEPYGKVLVKHKDDYEENAVFIQENYYCFCRVTGTKGEVKLDDYEKEEGFTPEWQEPFAMHYHNRYCRPTPENEGMIKRETMMLDMVDLEMRRRKRIDGERALLNSLPKPDGTGVGNYYQMLEFVRDVLSISKEDMTNKEDIAYSRFEHTKRVLGWMVRLYNVSEIKDKLKLTDLVIATIFHDVGRPAGDMKGISHAEAGGPIVREYLSKLGYEKERIEFIAMLVEKHSDKYLMKEADTDPNLILLMEADLMDDAGAQGIVMDCMITEKRNPKAQFVNCLDHMTRYTRAIQQNNPMVTEAAKKMWDEKTALVNTFVDAFEKDCTISLVNTQ